MSSKSKLPSPAAAEVRKQKSLQAKLYLNRIKLCSRHCAMHIYGPRRSSPEPPSKISHEPTAARKDTPVASSHWLYFRLNYNTRYLRERSPKTSLSNVSFKPTFPFVGQNRKDSSGRRFEHSLIAGQVSRLSPRISLFQSENSLLSRLGNLDLTH